MKSRPTCGWDSDGMIWSCVDVQRKCPLRRVFPSQVVVSSLRFWRSSVADFWPRRTCAHGVSVDAQLAGHRPVREAFGLGLLHILPQSPLANGGYLVLLRPGFARPQVPVHLACFQCCQMGVAPASAPSMLRAAPEHSGGTTAVSLSRAGPGGAS